MKKAIKAIRRRAFDVAWYAPMMYLVVIAPAYAVGGPAVAGILGFATALGIGIASVGIASVGWHYVFAHENSDMLKRGVAALVGGGIIAGAGQLGALAG